MRPERIVVGKKKDMVELLRELYEPFSSNYDQMILMDIRSAELTKYAANCMLATKISFMNEIANIAELLGADIAKVRQGIGSYSRIGYSIVLFILVVVTEDPVFLKTCSRLYLIRTAERMDYHPKLLQEVEGINDQKKS